MKKQNKIMDILLSFELAFTNAKEGKKISRKAFRDTCYLVAKYPDINSQNTEPYLQMYKRNTVPADTMSVSRAYNVFPVDISCESLFAEDWYVLEEINNAGLAPEQK
jgi:hypothetical protein